MIEEIKIFVYVWCSSFLIHECMHLLSQKCLKGRIFIDYKNLSFTCYPDEVNNHELLDYSGGLFTSIIMFLMAIGETGAWYISFMAVGIIQFGYGIIEGNSYEKYRYYWYVLCIGVLIILWSLASIF